MINISRRPILSVSSNDEDFVRTCGALKEAQVANPVWRCADRQAAVTALDTEEGCAKTREAAFVLLDLDMPELSGRELLERFRRHERKTRVLVLSTASRADDVAFCYRAGANGFFIKPAEYDGWKDMMAKLTAYWLRLALLPHSGGTIVQAAAKAAVSSSIHRHPTGGAPR